MSGEPRYTDPLAHSLGVLIHAAGGAAIDGHRVAIYYRNSRLNDRFVPESAALELRRELDELRAQLKNAESQIALLTKHSIALREIADAIDAGKGTGLAGWEAAHDKLCGYARILSGGNDNAR